MKAAHRYEFRIHLTADACLEYYRGTARHVIARSFTGQTLQFPASLLQKFISADGVHGNFVLLCDEHHKCLGLQRQES